MLPCQLTDNEQKTILQQVPQVSKQELNLKMKALCQPDLCWHCPGQLKNRSMESCHGDVTRVISKSTASDIICFVFFELQTDTMWISWCNSLSLWHGPWATSSRAHDNGMENKLWHQMNWKCWSTTTSSNVCSTHKTWAVFVAFAEPLFTQNVSKLQPWPPCGQTDHQMSLSSFHSPFKDMWGATIADSTCMQRWANPPRHKVVTCAAKLNNVEPTWTKKKSFPDCFQNNGLRCDSHPLTMDQSLFEVEHECVWWCQEETSHDIPILSCIIASHCRLTEQSFNNWEATAAVCEDARKSKIPTAPQFCKSWNNLHNIGSSIQLVWCRRRPIICCHWTHHSRNMSRGMQWVVKMKARKLGWTSLLEEASQETGWAKKGTAIDGPGVCVFLESWMSDSLTLFTTIVDPCQCSLRSSQIWIQSRYYHYFVSSQCMLTS